MTKKVECTSCGCVIQVTSRHLIEQDMILENSDRFILAYISPLLQDKTSQDLCYSGQGQLRKNVLLNRTDAEISDERLKDLMRLFHNSKHPKMYPFVIVAQCNENWSHSDEKIFFYISSTLWTLNSTYI